MVALVLGVLGLTIPRANADTIDQVSGTLLITGAPASETVNFDFDIEPGFYPGTDQFNTNFTPVNVSSTGPLADFGYGNPQESTGYETIKSFVSGFCVSTPGGNCAEIDFAFEVAPSGSGYTFLGLQPEWFQCSGTCAEYFTPSGTNQYGIVGDYAPITLEDLTYSVVSTPEPSSALLLVLGLFGLILLSWKVKELRAA